MKLFFIICMLFLHKATSQTSSCDANESKLAAVTDLVCSSDTSYNTNVKRGKKGPKGTFQDFVKKKTSKYVFINSKKHKKKSKIVRLIK